MKRKQFTKATKITQLENKIFELENQISMLKKTEYKIKTEFISDKVNVCNLHKYVKSGLDLTDQTVIDHIVKNFLYMETDDESLELLMHPSFINKKNSSGTSSIAYYLIIKLLGCADTRWDKYKSHDFVINDKEYLSVLRHISSIADLDTIYKLGSWCRVTIRETIFEDRVSKLASQAQKILSKCILKNEFELAI